MDNAADRKSIRAAEKASRFRERESADVLVNLMSTTSGRAWVWARLEAAHVFQSSFAEDALRTAFLEGERNQGIVLLAEVMRWCPDQFIQAMREANERHASSSRSPAAEHTGSEDGDRGDQADFAFDSDDSHNGHNS